MKKIKIILVSCAFIISFTSCSALKKEKSKEETSMTATEEITENITEIENTENVTEPEIPTETEEISQNESKDSNGELEVTYTGKTKEIGDDGYGYIEVPEEWVKFHDAEDDGTANLYQYSSMDTASVITLSYNENLDAEKIADFYYSSYSNDSVEGLSAAMVTLDGREAYQIYAYFTDVNKIMVTWVFDGDDGMTHVLSIESQDYNIISLSGTYKLNK